MTYEAFFFKGADKGTEKGISIENEKPLQVNINTHYCTMQKKAACINIQAAQIIFLFFSQLENSILTTPVVKPPTTHL